MRHEGAGGDRNPARRDVLAAALGLGIAGGLRRAGAAEAPTPAFKTRLLKALIVERPTADRLKAVRDAGFDGVEAGVLPVAEAEKARADAGKIGLRIHSVIRGWAEFNSLDPARADASFAVTEDALRAARAYGADAVLLVPCRIGGMPMPKPREFDLEFDDSTGLLRRVVAGDNAPYEAYLQAHNRAIEMSRERILRLIPLAERSNAAIAIENVWNNLWVRPAHFRHFVASFRSPWVRAYFDIGNHVKYAAPETWIAALGGLLAKCHVKDFKLSDDPGGGGRFVDIREGSVRWPAVRAALDRAGYNGFLTIEGGSLSPAEHARRLDRIIAGE
jgi:hexulose-6-phosphate isomerase